MAAENAARIIRAPGRLVVAPSNLSAAYPYGGTEVGKVRLAVLQALGTNFRVVSEGLGEATDVLEASNEYVFACFLRGWDDDAVQQFYGGNYTAGTVSGHAVFDEPGTTTPGASALSRGKIVLYVPDDVVHVPSVLIYRGVPDWQAGAEFAMQRGEEVGLPVAIDCLRDANDNILRVGVLADLSLT
jgi:hypothetical protein